MGTCKVLSADGSFWLWEDCEDARVHIKEFVLILRSGGLTQSDVLLLHAESEPQTKPGGNV